jgi:hypothetical protein
MSAWLGVASMIVAAAASGAVKVPATGTDEIILDGHIGGTEWSDATRVTLGEGVTVLIKANSESVAIAVKSGARGPQFTDLYLTGADGKVWNLHAEQQTSERKLEGTTWSDTDPAFVWYNNASWSAYVVQLKPNADPTAPMAKQIKPYDGQEFLIGRSQFVGKAWQLRIEVHDLAREKPDVIYPATSDRYDATGWATVTLP